MSSTPGRLHDARDGLHETAPFRVLERQLLFAGCRQSVVLRALLVLRQLPFRADPPLTLEAVEGRVERSMIDREHVIRARPDGEPDPVAMLWSLRERAQNQHVERALQELDAILVAAGRGIVGDRLPPRMSNVYHIAPALSFLRPGVIDRHPGGQ